MIGQSVHSAEPKLEQNAHADDASDKPSVPKLLSSPGITTDLIRAIRERFRFTLEQMARHAGVALQTWHRWEHGIRFPRTKQRELIETLRQEAQRLTGRRDGAGEPKESFRQGRLWI